MIRYQSYEDFLKDAECYIKQITEAATDYVSRFNLGFYIDESPDFFSNEYYADAIACYESASVFEHNELTIALHLKNLYNLYNSTDDVDFNYNLRSDLIITIFHEIGHGLIEYLCDDSLFPEDGDILIPEIIWDDNYDEEEIVEKFGLSFAPDYTYVNSKDSELRLAFEYVAEQLSEEDN